ncbi:bile acid:sodium symporter family protein [Caldibacillus lycopersici]|uniref:Bile acid:sodium symporter family protein n=1 Tax=Perspicuibacillus lycopersici TaxID=1325689 RepID=A0AAE3IUE2_9BACI|nr:bile acid:sodium symporter family protein [Perspicuibacillus lycopersici]MCU9614783.1 bile acid:sodium symporter family protein [Perspicuibacillus lycopersici]
MLQKINRTLEKWMPLITPTGVLLGIIFSVYLEDLSSLVPWLFAFMTFEGSLTMNFQAMKGAVLHPFPVFTLLIFLHFIMPLWAWGVGHLAFFGDGLTITGIILGMVIPTGITSFIWVSMKHGNSALTLAIILLDSLLSPFVVPFSLSMFVGQTVELDVANMMIGLVFMIVLPSIVAMLLNQVTKGKATKVWKPRLSPISKLCLGIVVMLNGATVAPYFKHFNGKLLFIIVIVFFIACSGYFFAYLLAKGLKFDEGTTIASVFIGGMRNISAGAVMAIAYFPSAVVLPVVVGMLFQQSLASIYGSFLNKVLKRNVGSSKSVSA